MTIIREIISLDDPAWPAWYALYETSFPVDERLGLDHYHRIFAHFASGTVVNEHILVMEDPAVAAGVETAVIGIALVEKAPDMGMAFLWYIAVSPHSRNNGNGAILYAHILNLIRQSEIQMLVIEVDIPAETAVNTFDHRRINWYRRQGAHLLEGIDYDQVVSPDIPAKKMHLMVHPFQSITPAHAFTLLKPFFQELLTQNGPLQFS